MKKQPDIKLLLRVLSNQAKSFDDKAQLKFALNIIQELKNITNKFKYEFDNYGNLYVTKGSSELYPCVVAHLDQVHKYVKHFSIKQLGDWIIGFNEKEGIQVGCGADDKVGVSIAIEMFKLHPNIKLFFPKDEEVGGLGSNNCNIEFFNDCCFMIQPDRNMYKDKKDYINYTNGIEVTTPEFDAAVDIYKKKYGYTDGFGTFTDIGELVYNGVNICCFNLSCYLNAHSNQETVYLPLYKDAFNFVNDVIKNLSYKQWVLPKVQKPSYNSWNKKYDTYDWEDDVYDKDLNYNTDEKYYLSVEEEIDTCPWNCEWEGVEYTLEGTYHCGRCNKTLGLSKLIEDAGYNKMYK